MTRFTKFTTVLGLALVAVAATAEAQSAQINVTANVFQALTVTGNQPLDFGNVFPGVNKTVAVGDAGAGKFTVAGQAGANVNLSFTLPANLPHASLPTSLPIGSWSGHWATTDVTSGGTSFTPSAGNTAANLHGTTGNLYVYLGAQVSPGGAQAAGSYSAQLTMTVAYF